VRSIVRAFSGITAGVLLTDLAIAGVRSVRAGVSAYCDQNSLIAACRMYAGCISTIRICSITFF